MDHPQEVVDDSWRPRYGTIDLFVRWNAQQTVEARFPVHNVTTRATRIAGECSQDHVLLIFCCFQREEIIKVGRNGPCLSYLLPFMEHLWRLEGSRMLTQRLLKFMGEWSDFASPTS